ncbi:MAG TPA: SRPBCC family protein [Vicinamibacterales bacterium]|nr:SRPBCC family protein [Vicinamibacterales bacterium]
MQRNVSGFERVASAVAGALVLSQVFRGRAPRGAGFVTGTALVARGLGGYCPINAAIGRHPRRDDTRTALGGHRGLKLVASTIIARPIDEVFEYWRDLRNLPTFMTHLERVDEIDARRSHWVARGPADMPVEWDAEIINEVPPELIGWRSLPGSDVATAGSVRFRAVPMGTEVRVLLQYDPPGGKAGAAVGWLFGLSPSATLRADLRRLKDLLEGASRASFGEGLEARSVRVAISESGES